MPTTLSFKDIIDLPQWRPAAPSPVASAAGSSWAYDMRNDVRNAPFNYLLLNATSLYAYLPHNDEFLQLASPALTGTFGAGATCVFHPTQGPRGTIAAGASTTAITLSTALPAAVAANQLANNGAGIGFVIRIIDNAAGGTGRTEEKRIIANTAGTAPTITLDSALTFTPVTGAAYEIRSGRLYMLSAGTLAAGMFKHYDVATNSVSGNLATTNLPATVGGDSSMVALSEGHMPSDRTLANQEGFIGQITSAAGNTTTTIVSATLPNSTSLFADEYRNFQIRIVQDATNPTAAGQRRRISTHGAGTTPTFTVSAAWTVTPSAAALFVIENDDDKLLLFTNQTAIYNYNIAANTWDTTTWAAAAAAGAAGISATQAFGISRDTTGNARHSQIFRVRGGNVNIIDVFDIAGAATGAWTADIAYGNKALTNFNTGTCGAYDPITNGGRYVYLNISGTQRNARFDLRHRVLEPWTFLRFPQGVALVGAKNHMAFFFDGSTKMSFLYHQTNTQTQMFSVAASR